MHERLPEKSTSHSNFFNVEAVAINDSRLLSNIKHHNRKNSKLPLFIDINVTHPARTDSAGMFLRLDSVSSRLSLRSKTVFSTRALRNASLSLPVFLYCDWRSEIAGILVSFHDR